MFQSLQKKQFVIAACLLCGAFVRPTVFAGPYPSITEIDGEYTKTTLGDQQESYSSPVNFSLTNGSVTSPSNNPDLTGFAVPNFDVTINGLLSPPTVALTNTTNITEPSDFILSGGASGTIDYAIDSSFLSGSTGIGSELTLVSNTAGVDLSGLSIAELIFLFPPQYVNFDPHWAGYNASPPQPPVLFEIVPLPEPASIVHLTWLGVLGMVGWRRRHRRSACAVAA